MGSIVLGDSRAPVNCRRSKVGYIYVIENRINGKLYVGQTKNPTQRKYAHYSRFSSCTALTNAIKKYGSENFEFFLLEKCFSQKELDKRERPTKVSTKEQRTRFTAKSIPKNPVRK